jgi:hypothetical protein
MNADQQSDFLLEVYLDGRFIQTVPLDVPTAASPDADAGTEMHRCDPSPGTERTTHRSTVYLPASGPVRLELDLRRGEDDPLRRNRSTVVYDASSVGRVVDALGRTTTYWYNSPGAIRREPPEPPPDEPHIVE